MVETDAGYRVSVAHGHVQTNRGALAISGAHGRAGARLAALLCCMVLFAGCAVFPVTGQPVPAPAPAPETGAGPELPPELPPMPPETAPAPQPEARPVPTPMPEPAPGYHAASEALVEQARREADLGNAAAAGATLERALRIDGNNPWIWIELGHLRLAAGQQAAAESMARKALSLAARDPAARSAAASLLQQAGSGR